MRLFLAEEAGRWIPAMIIVRCMGGLGNQMFQYAIGRVLARRYSERLLLDLSLYDDRPLRNFELDHYAVNYRRASLRDLARFVDLGNYGRIVSAPWRLVDRGRCRVIRERFFQFDPAVLESGNRVLLDGYWQSARYFESIAAELRKEFAPQGPLERDEAAIDARIAATNAVALHVRGGDYRSDPSVRRTLGVCAPEYYRAAVARVRECVEDPTFFVFSDDPCLARSVLPAGEIFTLIEGRIERNWVDQYLMSRCRHQVIANSTFSWWAAWLNSFPGKTVVAPRRWFRDGALDTRDLFPEGWVTL